MGDGGAVLTSDDHIATRCRQLRDHGRLEKDVTWKSASIGGSTNAAAALRVLLRRLDTMNERRPRACRALHAWLVGLPLVPPATRPRARHVYHLFVSGLRGARSWPRFSEIGESDRHPLSDPTHRQPGRRCSRRWRTGQASSMNPQPADDSGPHGRETTGWSPPSRILSALPCEPRVLQVYPKTITGASISWPRWPRTPPAGPRGQRRDARGDVGVEALAGRNRALRRTVSSEVDLARSECSCNSSGVIASGRPPQKGKGERSRCWPACCETPVLILNAA